VFRPEERPVKVSDPRELFIIIRAAFGQRRKTLVNALGNAAGLHYSKEQITDALNAMGKDASIRGEVFTLEEFAQLAELLKKGS